MEPLITPEGLYVITPEDLYELLAETFQAGVRSTTSDYNAEDCSDASEWIQCADNFEAWLEDARPDVWAYCFEYLLDPELGDLALIKKSDWDKTRKSVPKRKRKRLDFNIITITQKEK